MATDAVISLFKTAAEPSVLKGKLYLSQMGFLLLSVPNAIGRGAFAALAAPGTELPPSPDGKYSAHITVMRPEELEQIGGAHKITERGRDFGYTLGKIKDFNPVGWPEMSRCWVLEAKSPELEKLRRSYGLPSLPVHHVTGEPMAFHVTFAVRRNGVLSENDVSKVTADTKPTKQTAWDKPGTQLVKAGETYYHKTLRALPTKTAGLALKSVIAEAAKKAVTPKSEAQAEAGNYQKGHFSWKGLRISIECAKGMRRKPEWKPMTCPYGYFRGTEGRDGDHVDVFVGPQPESELVFVIDQVTPTGRFDEHKVVVGCLTKDEAKALYLSNYEDGWQGLGKITALTVHQFKEWLKDGNQTRPVSTQVFTMKKAKEDDAPDDDTPMILVLQQKTTIRMIPPEKQPRDDDGKFESKDDLTQRLSDEFERLLANFDRMPR